ncbi:MAG: 50S ribosomal protein L21 [Gammaproteobacteria bacterium]|nr:50S ribosomal protein L21 [Gammaproteobacteria bacterium]NNM00586.1 50S ribosomal protein L21 [Gammaproteobacteria bacterium]
MYAVIKTGGKQYRVSEGDRLAVEKLTAEAGSDVSIDDVLMVADGDDIQVGTPTLAGASVTAKVIAHDRAAKINIIKFKRRKHYRRQMGHRQHQTHLEITKISKG